MCEHGADALGEQPGCTASFPSSPAPVCQLWGAWRPPALQALPDHLWGSC